MTGVGPGCCVHAARLHDEDGCRICGCPGGDGEFPEVRVRVLTPVESAGLEVSPAVSGIGRLEAWERPTDLPIVPLEPQPVVVATGPELARLGREVVQLGEPGKIPCPHPGCDRTFDKPQGVGPHRRKAHGYVKPSRGEVGYVGRHRAAAVSS